MYVMKTMNKCPQPELKYKILKTKTPVPPVQQQQFLKIEKCWIIQENLV